MIAMNVPHGFPRKPQKGLERGFRGSKKVVIAFSFSFLGPVKDRRGHGPEIPVLGGQQSPGVGGEIFRGDGMGIVEKNFRV
ncbi:MAG TPA: hypothetical protein PKD69_03160, partial [Elusimicrobiota bacterium]|nr:hypothetical protein [Elusimicrobiota bacterium]